MANNSVSTYHSHSVVILGVCRFSHAVQFFPCGWVPNTFKNMVALNTAVDLQSLHSQFWRASVHHALKALQLCHSVKMITSQVQFQIAKFKFCQYQNTTFFRHFTKFNAHQIFPLYSNPFIYYSDIARPLLLQIIGFHSLPQRAKANRTQQYAFLGMRKLKQLS